MNTSAPTPDPSDAKPQGAFVPEAPHTAASPPVTHAMPLWHALGLGRFAWVLALLACLGCLMLWMKLTSIEELLAKQSANTSELAQEAKSLAKEASELSRDTAAHLSLTDGKLSEVALQRTQLDALMQTLTRSRDENTLDEL